MPTGPPSLHIRLVLGFMTMSFDIDSYGLKHGSFKEYPWFDSWIFSSALPHGDRRLAPRGPT